MGSISGAGVSSLPKDHKMILDEIVRNVMFGKSNDESLKGFDEVETGLNSIKEENNTNEEMANKKYMSKKTWNLEVNRLVMKCYLMSEPSKRRH